MLTKPMEYTDARTALGMYSMLNYPIVLLILLLHLHTILGGDMKVAVFSTAVFLTYGVLYLAPAWVTGRLALSLARRLVRGNTLKVLTLGVAAPLMSLALMMLFVDGQVYSMYGFHLNGFVWNLVTTPGGIASMGMSESAVYFAMGFMVVTVALEAGLAYLTLRFLEPAWRVSGFHPSWKRIALAAFLLLTLTERVAFGFSSINAYAPIVLAANAFPLYQPTSFRGTAKALGYSVPRNKTFHLPAAAAAHLRYPARPLEITKPEKPLNIVWLVAESWRWDMLSPDIMPDTWRFAQQARRYTHHYSGGNGTRMGLFSMFFGLYGNYWFPMLAKHQGPVLMDVLQREGYQLQMYTSASFSYPEFDKTIFAQMPSASLHQDQEGPSWKRDQANVSDLISGIARRDRARPFLSFMFFESPHAPYLFPPESAIRKPYLENLNYATMDLKRDMGLIKNRYLNACHHLDSQFARIIEHLRKEGLLDSTLVILTGDHGEEFMEKGHWGHNSDFVEEQIRVPLVLWVPGTGPVQIDRMTSHLDLPATLLPLLGVQNHAEDYSLGQSLLEPHERDYVVLASWTDLGYRDDSYKASFPLEGPSPFGSKVNTGGDKPLAQTQRFFEERQGKVVEMLKNSVRFAR